MAKRLKVRAYRRAGELLKEFDARGNYSEESKKDGSAPFTSQHEVAEEAGLSERQRKTAVRLANIPKEDFETQVGAGFD